MENLKVASFFCGCGGSDLGTLGGFDYLGRRYARLPFDIAYAGDFDKWAVETYNANFEHPAACADITKVDFSELPDADVLIGGFPCQSFSMVNQNGRNDEDDRSKLYRQIVRFLREKQPKAFVCENVRGLVTMKGGAVIARIAEDFGAAGYDVVWRLLDAADFGVPQYRKRVIIVGLRKDLGASYSYPEPVTPGDSQVPVSAVVKTLDGVDERWFCSERSVRSCFEFLRTKEKNQWSRGNFVKLDKPSPTITAHMANHCVNGSDPTLVVDAANLRYRRYTLEETATMQSFPDSFKWPCSVRQSSKQIGNSVAPVFFWHVMGKLAEALTGAPAPSPEDI